jgi:hypothetical protein
VKKICSLVLAGGFSLSAVHATLVAEKFATDPSLDGWQVFGDPNLFHWNATNQNLEVTWDSSQTNSYFYHPLGATYSKTNDFLVQFDVQVNDASASGYGFELAIGLLNYSAATDPDFLRGGGAQNLFEFDYFPTDDYGDPASIDATLKDSQSGYAGFYFVYDDLPLNPGVTYQVVFIHRAGASSVTGEVFTNGQVYTSLPDIYSNGANDFQFDTLAISSYNDGGYGSFILAHGTVDNLAFASPLPVGTIHPLAAGQVQFASDTNWLYTIEQTTNFQIWTPAASALLGNGTNLILQATNPPADRAFYRVGATLP